MDFVYAQIFQAISASVSFCLCLFFCPCSFDGQSRIGCLLYNCHTNATFFPMKFIYVCIKCIRCVMGCYGIITFIYASATTFSEFWMRWVGVLFSFRLHTLVISKILCIECSLSLLNGDSTIVGVGRISRHNIFQCWLKSIYQMISAQETAQIYCNACKWIKMEENYINVRFNRPQCIRYLSQIQK